MSIRARTADGYGPVACYNTPMANILIVDDDADARESIALFLRESGHKAVCAPNGREALMVVLERTPDVILLDLLMPEMDGPSFLEVIRSYLRIQSLPVVVLTGLSDSPMIERARSLKVNSILLKGKATPDEILKDLEHALVHHPG
jgi:CheY-like chemotaxis protein